MGFIIVDKYAIIIYCIFFYEFTVVENILITMNYNLKEKKKINQIKDRPLQISFHFMFE